MDHVAILSKKLNLLSKIRCGEKTIESRWTIHRQAPYQAIAAGDTIYFKDSGEPVTVRATVEKALFFSDLTIDKIGSILRQYGNGICMPASYRASLSRKRCCTLIFLTNVQPIPPFHINKTGYGMMAAWISVPDISSLQRVHRS